MRADNLDGILKRDARQISAKRRKPSANGSAMQLAFSDDQIHALSVFLSRDHTRASLPVRNWIRSIHAGVSIYQWRNRSGIKRAVQYFALKEKGAVRITQRGGP